jgi:hypothetical protein
LRQKKENHKNKQKKKKAFFQIYQIKFDNLEALVISIFGS